MLVSLLQCLGQTTATQLRTVVHALVVDVYLSTPMLDRVTITRWLYSLHSGELFDFFDERCLKEVKETFERDRVIRTFIQSLALKASSEPKLKHKFHKSIFKVLKYHAVARAGLSTLPCRSKDSHHVPNPQAFNLCEFLSQNSWVLLLYIALETKAHTDVNIWSYHSPI